ncbi:hypothetical protein B0H13DRAFT_1855965 [Mycena leptocephala]|nr:hypothetical protein B0H13DRAFT_1855965 [Mycena leptocephala]
MAVYEDKPVDRQAGRSAAAQPKRPAPRVDHVASNKLEVAKDLSREQCGGKQAKIGAFFQVETPEEREKMRPRELETFRVTKEVREAEEQQRKYKARSDNAMNDSDAPITGPWKPGVSSTSGVD